MSNNPIVSFAPQGDYMSLKVPGRASAVRPVKRGKVTGFSWRSRSRLMQKIAKLNKRCIPVFVTLTYHEKWGSPVEVKAHLNSFLKRLFYKFDQAGVIWKLEYQERGAPHFHLLVFGVGLLDLMQFVPENWVSVADDGNAIMLAWHRGELKNDNRHCVQEIRSWRGVKSYASKYLGKVLDLAEGDTPGRFWGSQGLVPLSKILEFRINLQASLQWRRGVKRKVYPGMRRVGFWSFGYHADWITYLCYCADNFGVMAPPENFPAGWWLNMGERVEVEVLQ